MPRIATQNICARKSILQQKKKEVSELYGILERLEWELITEYERLWRQKSTHYSSQEMTRARGWKL